MSYSGELCYMIKKSFLCSITVLLQLQSVLLVLRNKQTTVFSSVRVSFWHKTMVTMTRKLSDTEMNQPPDQSQPHANGPLIKTITSKWRHVNKIAS